MIKLKKVYHKVIPEFCRQNAYVVSLLLFSICSSVSIILRLYFCWFFYFELVFAVVVSLNEWLANVDILTVKVNLIMNLLKKKEIQRKHKSRL